MKRDTKPENLCEALGCSCAATQLVKIRDDRKFKLCDACTNASHPLFYEYSTPLEWLT